MGQGQYRKLWRRSFQDYCFGRIGRSFFHPPSHRILWGSLQQEKSTSLPKSDSSKSAFFPQADDNQEKAIYDTFLSKAGVTSLKELRDVDEDVLKNASNLMIQRSPYGTFAFAPAEDGDYTPAPPSLLLKNGQFWHSIQVMVANNGDEGLLLAPPHIQSGDEFP